MAPDRMPRRDLELVANPAKRRGFLRRSGHCPALEIDRRMWLIPSPGEKTRSGLDPERLVNESVSLSHSLTNTVLGVEPGHAAPLTCSPFAACLEAGSH